MISFSLSPGDKEILCILKSPSDYIMESTIKSLEKQEKTRPNSVAGLSIVDIKEAIVKIFEYT